MALRPILFSGPLVRAILEGRKTETRRLVTKSTSVSLGDRFDRLNLSSGWRDAMGRLRLPTTDNHGRIGSRVAPRIEAGDKLWVREHWRTGGKLDEHSPRKIGEMARDGGCTEPWAPVWFEADGAYNRAVSAIEAECGWGGRGRLRISMHMPAWASRIKLDVESVHPERLHQIDDAGARSEGVGPTLPGQVPRAAFADLWDTINLKRCPWASNPWVWVIRFRVQA